MSSSAEHHRGERRANWHRLTLEEVFDLLETTESGLTSTQIANRLDEFRPNVPRREEGASPLRLFLSQFNDFLIYLLLLAALPSLVVGVLRGFDPNHIAAHDEALILTPVMLLWINLVTDGLPALGLGVDPKTEGILDRPPRGPDEPVIDRRMLASIVAIGAIITATGLALFFYGLSVTESLMLAQTVLFTFLVVVEMVRIQVIRRRCALSIWSNQWLIGAIAVTVGLQLIVLYTPGNAFFGVVPLALDAWAWVVIGFGGFILLNLVMDAVLNRMLLDSHVAR